MAAKYPFCSEPFYATLEKWVVYPLHSLISSKPQDLHMIFPESHIPTSGAAYFFVQWFLSYEKLRAQYSLEVIIVKKKAITPNNSSAIKTEKTSNLTYLLTGFCINPHFPFNSILNLRSH